MLLMVEKDAEYVMQYIDMLKWIINIWIIDVIDRYKVNNKYK